MNATLLALIATTLFASCATHSGMISTSSNLNSGLQYTDIARGVAQSNEFLGIGGLSQDALVFEARRQLVKYHPLKSNEEYTNYTVDFKRTLVLVNVRTKVTVTADIVRFVMDTASERYTESYKKQLSRAYPANDLFASGDSIIFKKDHKGVINAFDNEKKIRVQYFTKRDKLRTRKVSINKIFSTDKSFNGYNIGDWYIFNKMDEKGNKRQASGKIVATGLNSALFENQTGTIRDIDYSDLVLQPAEEN